MSEPLFDTELLVVPALDQAAPGRCVAWDDDYVERYWLGILGPSAVWAYRRLAASALRGDEVLNLAHLAAELGLGASTGPNSAVVRTLVRLIRFHVISVAGWQLQVHLHLPTLNFRQLLRLPEHLQLAHQADMGHAQAA